MKYETWKEPGKTGKTYFVFYGLKNTAQIEEAAKTVARVQKLSIKNIHFETAWIKNGELYLGNGPVVGAKKAIAFYRRVK